MLDGTDRRPFPAAIAVLGVAAYAEVFWRCWRARPTVDPLPRPDVPRTATLRIRRERRSHGLLRRRAQEPLGCGPDARR
jgi:hypothetical protein